jgi:hypothetical protein
LCGAERAQRRSYQKSWLSNQNCPRIVAASAISRKGIMGTDLNSNRRLNGRLHFKLPRVPVAGFVPYSSQIPLMDVAAVGLKTRQYFYERKNLCSEVATTIYRDAHCTGRGRSPMASSIRSERRVHRRSTASIHRWIGRQWVYRTLIVCENPGPWILSGDEPPAQIGLCNRRNLPASPPWP